MLRGGKGMAAGWAGRQACVSSWFRMRHDEQGPGREQYGLPPPRPVNRLGHEAGSNQLSRQLLAVLPDDVERVSLPKGAQPLLRKDLASRLADTCVCCGTGARRWHGLHLQVGEVWAGMGTVWVCFT